MLTPFQSRARRALAKTPFFGGLEEDEMRCVFRSSVRRGDGLFHKNEPSERLFGLMSGHLKVFSEGASGGSVTLAHIGPGELVGELGIVDGAPQHASVQALANSELATIKRRDLERLLERRPDLGVTLSRASSAAARNLVQRAEDAAFLSLETRIEKALDDFAQRLGESVEDGVLIRLRQQDLADFLGTTRESVSRVLSLPEMRSRLQVGRGSIVVLKS